MKLLTPEILKKDGPLFEFVIIEVPYPVNCHYWPDRSEVTPHCFLKFGEYVMDELFTVFKIDGDFNPYELTNYSLPTELNQLIINIESEIDSISNLSKYEFICKFGSIFSLVEIYEQRQKNAKWDLMRSDIIEILLIIKDKAQLALQARKTLAIIGI